MTAEIRPIGGMGMRRSRPQTGQGWPAAGQGWTATLKEPTHDDQTWALMAYVGQFVLVLFAPTIVLLLKGRSLYIRRHAVQALNLALSVTAIWVAGALLSLVMPWLLVVPIGYTLLSLALLIRAAMAANKGDFYRIPALVAWPLAR